MNTEQCQTCYCWDAEHKKINGKEITAYCMFSPPRVFHIGDKFYTLWPSTRSTSKCGQYQEAIAHESL